MLSHSCGTPLACTWGAGEEPTAQNIINFVQKLSCSAFPALCTCLKHLSCTCCCIFVIMIELPLATSFVVFQIIHLHVHLKLCGGGGGGWTWGLSQPLKTPIVILSISWTQIGRAHRDGWMPTKQEISWRKALSFASFFG